MRSPVPGARSWRRRGPRAVIVVLGLAVAAGCANGASPVASRHVGALSKATPSASAGQGGHAGGASTTIQPGSNASPTTRPAPVANGSGPAAASGPAPAAPGTYTYDQQGSETALGSTQQAPSEGTIVVDAPQGAKSGTWTQTSHSYENTSQPPTDTTYQITPSGISIVSQIIRITAGGHVYSFTCTFSSPPEIVDWPPSVGHDFSGTADCGSFTAQVSGTMSQVQDVMVNGSSITTYVVKTTITTSGQVNSTESQTDWFDPVSDIVVQEQTQAKGTYGGVPFQQTLARQIVSVHPS